ncbi:MAG: hypothetical protein K2M31_00895 [Muribaculaceae bacterium]|nr:hypothetical protein [Muribaculaceae bacterium]
MQINRYKYIWLPALLLIYGAVIGILYGRDFIADGRIWQFVATMAADLAVCIALFFALRKRQRLADARQ